MPEIKVEYTTHPLRSQQILSTFDHQVNEWKKRVFSRRIFVLVLGLAAILLRLGVQTAVLLTGNPNDVAVYIYHEWYEHPVLFYGICLLFAPITMMSFVATEKKADTLSFLARLRNKYCEYLQGLFSTSILVDLLQVVLQVAPAANLLSAYYYHIQGLMWINPQACTDQLSLLSYQATVTAYTLCFCIMTVNKWLNHRYFGLPISKVILRTIVIGVVTPIVGAISIEWYDVYIEARVHNTVEFYYLSVILGMIVAIFEVQGAEGYDPPLSRYYVVLSYVRNGQLPSGIKLKNREPMNKKNFHAGMVNHISAQCFRHHQLAMQNYSRVHSRTHKGKNVDIGN